MMLEGQREALTDRYSLISATLKGNECSLWVCLQSLSISSNLSLLRVYDPTLHTPHLSLSLSLQCAYKPHVCDLILDQIYLTERFIQLQKLYYLIIM